MALTPRLDLRTSQQLVMTPQLSQAIGLLALSNVEIEAAVADEVERNPLLAFEGDEGSAPGRPQAADALGADGLGADVLIAAGAGAADAPLDADWEGERFHHDCVSDGSGPGTGGAFDFDRVACADGSLCEHLMRQAGSALDGADLAVARAIVGAVEETGYLGSPVAEIATAIGASAAAVTRVLGVVQSFDPPGVAARTLAECLALQALAADRYDPAMARLLANLELLGRGDMRALKRICGVDDEDLRDMIAEVRGYDPKPGCRFSHDAGTAVTPDLFVRRTADGWAVELNRSTLPRLIVDRRAHARLAGGGKPAQAFAAQALGGANWLRQALDNRARTILAVAAELVAQQRGFFDRGVSGLKPLTLARVADAVGVHETTVSRVASNKYLSCERGTFALKFFFTSGVAAADGGAFSSDGASAESVKSRIRALVVGEARDAVLSDDALVDMLRVEGVEIARRTVAKYREACGIGSSVQRRRKLAMERMGLDV